MSRPSPDDMIRMRRAGFKLWEISQMTDGEWSESKLSRYFKVLDVKPDEPITILDRPQHLKHHYPYDLLYEMYWGCELSMNEIAYELDVSDRTVQEIFRRLRIPRRTRSEAHLIAMRRNPQIVAPLLRAEGREKGWAVRSAKAAERRRLREYKREWRARRREQGLEAA